MGDGYSPIWGSGSILGTMGYGGGAVNGLGNSYQSVPQNTPQGYQGGLNWKDPMTWLSLISWANSAFNKPKIPDVEASWMEPNPWIKEQYENALGIINERDQQKLFAGIMPDLLGHYGGGNRYTDDEGIIRYEPKSGPAISPDTLEKWRGYFNDWAQPGTPKPPEESATTPQSGPPRSGGGGRGGAMGEPYGGGRNRTMTLDARDTGFGRGGGGYDPFGGGFGGWSSDNPHGPQQSTFGRGGDGNWYNRITGEPVNQPEPSGFIPGSIAGAGGGVSGTNPFTGEGAPKESEGGQPTFFDPNQINFGFNHPTAGVTVGEPGPLSGASIWGNAGMLGPTQTLGPSFGPGGTYWDTGQSMDQIYIQAGGDPSKVVQLMSSRPAEERAQMVGAAEEAGNWLINSGTALGNWVNKNPNQFAGAVGMLAGILGMPVSAAGAIGILFFPQIWKGMKNAGSRLGILGEDEQGMYLGKNRGPG